MFVFAYVVDEFRDETSSISACLGWTAGFSFLV